MKKEDFLKNITEKTVVNESASVGSVLGDPGSPTYGGFIGPLSRISKKKLNSRLFQTWKDSSVKNGVGVGRIAVPPQGYVKEHLYSTEGNLVTEGDLLDWFGGDLKQRPAYNGGQLVAIEPKCLAFPYCSQGAVDKPIKLIGESKEHMCDNCYGYCSHIAKETGKTPEFIAKLIREKYLSETIDMVKMDNINESVIKQLNESIELLDENYTEENKNLENTNTMENIQLTPEFASKCMSGIMENNKLAGCMYETLVNEGFLPETLNEGETYEGYCKTMMEDAEICMEMVKSCMMNEGSSCANEIANYISESWGNKGGVEETLYEDAFRRGLDPEERLEEDEEGIMEDEPASGSPNKYAKIEASVERIGARETAVKLVDMFIGRMLGGMSSSDLADTATFANGLDTVEEFLEDGDYEGAVIEAKETAQAMLEDEGMGMDMFGEAKMDEAPGVKDYIYNQLKDCIEKGHSYAEAKKHMAQAKKGWNLSMEDYLEVKNKYGKGERDGVELEEGSWEVDPSYNYFAINKATGKIFNGWEYGADTSKEEIKDYCKMDIKDNDWEPKDFGLVTIGYLKKKGIDAHDSDNWAKTDDISKYMDNLHGTNFAKYGGSNPDYMAPEARAKYEINELEEGSEDSSRYMFFSNLEQIKRQADLLMKFDHGKIEAILNSGHDWAADHMAVTKENLDQVFDFLMNEIEGDGAPEGDMTPAPMDMTPLGPVGFEGPEDKIMEYDEEGDDEDDVAVSDQYEREMKYFTNFMNAIEKSMNTLAKSLGSDEVKGMFNQYFSEFESSRNADADRFIAYIRKNPEESYLEYSDRLFAKGPENSILNLLTSPTKRSFLNKSGLNMDDNLTDSLDTVDELQPRVIKKAEFIRNYGEKQDSKYKDTEDDDFADEKEPSMGDLRNIEKMGNYDADGDDEDFLEEAELAKFVATKGKNVDSDNKKSSEKENKEAMKDAEETQETTEEKVDNLKNQKYKNNSFEDEATLRQHGRNNMLDLDYGDDTSEAFKDRIEKEADGLAPKDHANVDHESKGGEELKKAVKARRKEREMDYGSKGLNIDNGFSYERSDALKEDVVSLEIQKMMKMISYDQSVISEEKKAKKTNENDIFWKSVSKKKLL
jgi:hypothetical protein